MSIPVGPQKGADQNGVGVLKTILMVWLSSLSMRAMSRYWPEVVAAVAESAAYSQLKTTSSAVNGLPSCHVAFFRCRQVTVRASLAMSAFCELGRWVAIVGTWLGSGS